MHFRMPQKTHLFISNSVSFHSKNDLLACAARHITCLALSLTIRAEEICRLCHVQISRSAADILMDTGGNVLAIISRTMVMPIDARAIFFANTIALSRIFISQT